MNARIVAVLGVLFLMLRIASARVALAPGLAVPVAIPVGVVALAVVALGVWMIRRRARRFRSCPHPHMAFAPTRPPKSPASPPVAAA